MSRTISIFLWIRIARIRRKYERAATEQLRECGLSLAQFDLLTTLSTCEGTTQQALAKQLLVTQGNITQLLDKLEQRGLLTRQQEGRTNCLQITEQGRQLLATVLPAHTTWNAQQFSGLSIEEQRQLLRLLQKLERTMQ